MASLRLRNATIQIGAGACCKLVGTEALRIQGRRPVRLRFTAADGAVVTMEFSEREAYALSEWLDGAVTGAAD